MRLTAPNYQEVPLKLVTSNKFGRYPKISTEQVVNMIQSDGWMVPNSGYKKKVSIVETAEGRGLLSSSRCGCMFVVVDDGFYKINSTLQARFISRIDTQNGDVFLAENEKNEIAICDQKEMYLYNYETDVFQPLTLDFKPVHVSYQDGRFIAAVKDEPLWRLSDPSDSANWPSGPSNPQFEGTFQTKGDNVVATVPFPGKQNLLLVMGNIVTEIWVDVGAALFPYQRSSSVSIDYGCINPATIASGDNIVVWIGQNDSTGPVILVSQGGGIQKISTDGIDFKLANLSNPKNSYGFLYRQDGHLIYQFCFPDDNLSYCYDFNTQNFFTVTDENQDFHNAKRVVFFENSYYFLSFINGNIYELSTKYTTFDNKEIPKIVIPANYRLPDSSYFNINYLTFTIEQGNLPDIEDVYESDPSENGSSETPRVDLSISVDGGETYSSISGMNMNPLGKRKSQFIWYGLGMANDFVPQFRFWGKGRFVFANGVMGIY